MTVLKLENVSYRYDGKTNVIKDFSYEFEMGKVYAIVGRSGAGKTTLLSLLSGLTSPSEGKICYQDEDVSGMDRYKFRSQIVGVIFQQFNLLSHLTGLENVELSMRASGKKIEDKKKRAIDLLNSVDIDETLARRKILKLSGGEQQRVAIARALSFDPSIILADEPTGNLDLSTQDEVVDIFKRLAHESGKCVIIVTHSPEVAACADEVVELASLRKKKH